MNMTDSPVKGFYESEDFKSATQKQVHLPVIIVLLRHCPQLQVKQM